VVVLSGGLDSTVLLYHCQFMDMDCHAITFNYGQRHKKEIGFAKRTCEKLGVPHQVIDLTSFSRVLKGNALTDTSVEVPEGHYEAESMKQTVVPSRNLTSMASAYAVSIGAKRIALAVHAGDHAIYPDCRPDFMKAAANCLFYANSVQIFLFTPFISMKKEEIVRVGGLLGVNFEETWSCYKGGDEPCGKCGTCVEREEAIRLVLENP